MSWRGRSHYGQPMIEHPRHPRALQFDLVDREAGECVEVFFDEDASWRPMHFVRSAAGEPVGRYGQRRSHGDDAVESLGLEGCKEP
jgi:hypothetical protein